MNSKRPPWLTSQLTCCCLGLLFNTLSPMDTGMVFMRLCAFLGL
jgi:hypothetical protein